MTEDVITIDRARFSSEQTDLLDTALAAAMANFEPPAKTKTAKIETSSGGRNYQYQYAPIEEVIAACRRVLPAQGVWFQQTIVGTPGSALRLRTVVYHKSGQWLACDYPVIVGGRSDAQGFGSGSTFARRYSLQLALGIAAEDDDDANVAVGNEATIASRPQPKPAGGKLARLEEAQRTPEQNPDEFWVQGNYVIPVAELLVAGKARKDWKAFAGQLSYFIQTAPVRAQLDKLMTDNKDIIDLFKLEAKAEAAEIGNVYRARVATLKNMEAADG